MEEKRIGKLDATQLKLIAAFSMLLDHTGVLLFPGVAILRILGRLAYPVFAFMIAESCRYTRNKLRYFLMVFGLGAICQVVVYFFNGETLLNIMLTFSVSILLIYLLNLVDMAAKKGWWACWLWLTGLLAAVGVVWILCKYLSFVYGFWGILTPVLVALPLKKGETEKLRVLLLGVGMLMLGLDYGGLQYCGLAFLPLLLLYSGKRGNHRLKYFFYIFYPLHLVVLQGIAMLMK